MTARILCALTLSLLPLAAQSLEPPALPLSAKAIAVDAYADLHVKFHFVANGKQIYKCENGAWSKGSIPDATLYDMNSNAKIHHGAGPSWTMLDGSGAIKAIASTASHFPAPDGASIDWLKLEADKPSRTGVFSDVAIIQRLYTGAGKAPGTACTAGQTYESAYTAHYYFWAPSGTARAVTPIEQWKSAVLTSDKHALALLYSTNPPAVAEVGKTRVGNLEDEWQFWTSLDAAGFTSLNPKMLYMTQNGPLMNILLRIEALKADGSRVVASMTQSWMSQSDGWHIVATRRSDFAPAAVRRLPEPATPNTRLYSAPGEALQELKAASEAAAKENKRVLVVFGANWCYDCHVLDATFHSPQFAALVNANYEVAHVNIGEEGKDNNDLAARLGVVLDKGIPSLAVLEPDGTVVVAQKGGEFESTVKIGPEDVLAFLEKWKPAPR